MKKKSWLLYCYSSTTIFLNPVKPPTNQHHCYAVACKHLNCNFFMHNMDCKQYTKGFHQLYFWILSVIFYIKTKHTNIRLHLLSKAIAQSLLKFNKIRTILISCRFWKLKFQKCRFCNPSRLLPNYRFVITELIFCYY